jgi:hypothetical protein
MNGVILSTFAPETVGVSRFLFSSFEILKLTSGILQLLSGWIYFMRDSGSKAALTLRMAIDRINEQNDDEVKKAALIPAHLLLASCQGLAQPESKLLVEHALEYCEQLVLYEMLNLSRHR